MAEHDNRPQVTKAIQKQTEISPVASRLNYNQLSFNPKEGAPITAAPSTGPAPKLGREGEDLMALGRPIGNQEELLSFEKSRAQALRELPKNSKIIC